MCFSEDSRLLSESKIAIVGGTGRMGRVLSRVFKSSGGSVYLYSRDFEKARQVSEMLGVGACTLQEVYDADYVIVSVPVEEVVDVCFALSKNMKKSSILVEVSSIKTGIVDRVMGFLPEGLEYLSIHPLFGHRTDRFDDENIIVVDGREGPLTNSLLAFLRDQGLKISRVGVDEHDRLMARIQVIHHFAIISLGVSLVKNITSKDGRFYTRSFRKSLEIIRMLNENLSTVLNIQEYNPYSDWARNEFKKNVEELCDLKNLSYDKIRDYLVKIPKP